MITDLSTANFILILGAVGGLVTIITTSIITVILALKSNRKLDQVHELTNSRYNTIIKELEAAKLVIANLVEEKRNNEIASSILPDQSL